MTKETKKEIIENFFTLSCEEMAEYLPDFLTSRLKDEMILKMIKKHLEKSFSARGCQCLDKLLALQKAKEVKQ